MVEKVSSGNRPAHRPQARDRGFSVVELMMVFAIIAIMIAIALPSIFNARQTYAIDDASNQIVDILQFAQQRALGERQVMRVELVPGTSTTRGTIQVIDQNTLTGGVGDDLVIRNELLPENKDTTINTDPGRFPMPPLPFNFNHWTWPSGQLVIFLMPDGTATNAANTPQSLTLTMYVPLANGDPDPGLIRAVTLFGPTGSIRSWAYIPTTSQFEEV